MYEKVRQLDIAEAVGMSKGHLSDILAGKVDVGKFTAKKFGSFTGEKWTEFMDMEPKVIAQILRNTMVQRTSN